jgi:hypothetical protein
MSSDRPNQTLADYVALAISPALIMGLVSSLVFFLLTVLYTGDFVERLEWILFFFVFGAVLIARISMRGDLADRAALYGVPLGGLVWIGMGMFVEYPEEAGIRELSWVINLGLIGLVWWCAHRLTWDCTQVDEETEVSGEGLLQAAGLEKEQPPVSTPEEERPAEKKSWWERWQRYREERKKKRTLGVWVVYFSLAALPLFGLGQSLIPAEDVARRQWTFWLIIIYVGCGLGLLLTTCFLSLRRYLRQRRLRMPLAMTSVWLTVGGLMIAGLLLLGALLPRPDAEYSLFHIGSAKSQKRTASRWALKRDGPVQGEGQPGSGEQEDDKASNETGREERQKDGSKGSPTRQGKKGSGRGNDNSSNQTGDKQDNQGKSGQNQQNDGRGEDNQQTKGENGLKEKRERSSADRSGRDREGAERPGDDSRTGSQKTASGLRDLMKHVSKGLKWVVFAILGLIVLIFVLKSGLQFLANFTDWARRLLDALRNFWANLFGSWTVATEEEEVSEEQEERKIERPFASYTNPFLDGRTDMALPELIRYTFAAVQAWARERHLGRTPAETPLEFANRVGAEVPALEADLQRLVNLYVRAVYARGPLPGGSVELLRQFWERLETIAEQPLSA